MSSAVFSNKQQGSALVIAIFIIVILALLGSGLVVISSTAAKTTVISIQGARAHKAAESGMEWAIWRTLDTSAVSTDPVGVAATPPANCGAAPASTDTVRNFGNTVGLRGFVATISCSYTTHVEAGCQFHMITITSLGEFGAYGSEEYTSRSIQGVVSNRWNGCW